MSSIEEIESAIARLPEEEQWDLLSRFEEIVWRKWNTRIEDDSADGSLDEVIAGAKNQIARGAVTPPSMRSQVTDGDILT